MTIDPTTRVPAATDGLLDPQLARFILEQAEQMVVITGVGNEILWVNQSFVRTTGVSLEASIGRPAAQVIPVVDANAVQAEIDAAARDGRSFSGELPYVIQGKIRWFHVEICPMYSGDELICSVGFNRDITETMERASEREQGYRLKAIGSLAAGVAHEINTPVQFVSDNVQFLHESFEDLSTLVAALVGALDDHPQESEWKKRAEDADLEFLIAEIPAAIDQSKVGLIRVARIVEGMREFSKGGSGRFLTDLNQTITNTFDVTRGEWGYVADLDLGLSDEVESIICNEDEIKQVLLNLISNATHALEDRSDGRGQISVTSRVDGNDIEIVVTDTGIGMTPEVVAQAFDPFFTTKDVGKGAGQGLNTARAILVERHGGSISIDSQAGTGTAVTIRLPRSTD